MQNTVNKTKQNQRAAQQEMLLIILILYLVAGKILLNQVSRKLAGSDRKENKFGAQRHKYLMIY